MGIIDDIGGWTDRLKRVYDIAKDAKNVELSEIISDLRIAISDWKVKFAEIAEENLALQAKVKELENKLSVGDELLFRDGVYYRAEPIEGKPEGPFCPSCWETSKQIVSLSTLDRRFRFAGRFRCPKCTADIS